MALAVDEISHYVEYDYLVINDDFNTALDDLKSILRSARLNVGHQEGRYQGLLTALLS